MKELLLLGLYFLQVCTVYNLLSCADRILCGEKSLRKTNPPDASDNTEHNENDGSRRNTEFVKQAVFLHTSQCKYSPYQIHCQRIYPGILLVVLVQVNHQQKYKKKCQSWIL